MTAKHEGTTQRAVRRLRLKFPFGRTEGKREVMKEDCDGWVPDIVPQMLTTVFRLSNTAFSLCWFLLGSSIPFPPWEPSVLGGFGLDWAIKKRGGFEGGSTLEVHSYGYTYIGHDNE